MDDARHPADALTPAPGAADAAQAGAAATITVVSEPSQHGASPLWHPDEQALYWCDTAGRALHRLDPFSDARACWSFDTDVACCVPAVGGGLLLALRSGIWHFDPDGGGRTRLARPPYDPARERYGDGKADAHGRVWCGTLDAQGRPRAALYRTSRGRTLREADGFVTPAGLAWSPDARTLYVADSVARTVHAFDFDLGYGRRLLNDKRVFATFALPGGGSPGGAAVDTEGCYWVAMRDGARLLRLAPDGRNVGEVRLPVRCPTALCFGGTDLRTIYVTTASGTAAADGASARGQSDGCVLSLRVEVPGLQANFARRD